MTVHLTGHLTYQENYENAFFTDFGISTRLNSQLHVYQAFI